MESEKEKLGHMTTYIEKKSTAVAESMKSSLSRAGTLNDIQLSFNSPDAFQKPEFNRVRSVLLNSLAQSREYKEDPQNSAPRFSRMKSSAPDFPKPIPLNLQSNEDSEVSLSPSTGGYQTGDMDKRLAKNLVTLVDRAVKKDTNESFYSNLSRNSQNGVDQSFISAYESFDAGIEDDDKDFSILNDSTIQETLNKWSNLNSKFEARREQEGGFKKKKVASKALKEDKTIKKSKSSKKKKVKKSTDNKKSLEEIIDPSELSDLVGKVSLKKLTDVNQKLLEGQQKDSELHPYVQDYLRNQVFLKYPVNSKEAVVDEHPVHCDPNEKISIIKLVKDLIGKDISRITLPCYLNEPGTILNRLTEDLTYKRALDRACKEKDQYLRLGLTVATYFMNYSHSIERQKKPINPLLGETFELIWEDAQGITEQVSHHPPISAKFWKTKDYIVQCKTFIRFYPTEVTEQKFLGFE